jgi:heme/copper-type cytochrome/quinol oxidase subunit 2
MRKSAALLLALVFLTASCLIMAKPAVVSADPSPSPPLAQESTSTPETKQSSIPLIWLIAIAALVVVIIIELIIYFLLKGKKSKS